MENKRNMSALRDHLFDTLEKLKDKENPMEIERAEAVAHVSAQIINSAKVELQFLNTVGQEHLPSFADPQKTGKFFEADRQLPEKGLATGKHLGANGAKLPQ